MTTPRISSPVSTGGAGTFFEQHVAAYWLAQLLVRGFPPILVETNVAEVHLQTEHLGWRTDDCLIICEHPTAGTRKLVGQVKRTFTVSAADEDCRAALQDYWTDFKALDRFAPELDRLVLITQRGTNALLTDFVSLLDCARAARNGVEFNHRLETVGFISKKAVHYCKEICKIVSDLEGRVVTATDLWPFLKVLYVLSLDLDTSTRQTEAQIKSLLVHTTSEGNDLALADASWNALLALASTVMREAGSLGRDDLPEELLNRHGSLGTNEQLVLRALKDHTEPVLHGIRSMLGQGFHLQRAALVQSVLGTLETAQVVVVAGPAGSGKSAIGKDVVTFLSPDHVVFGFRVEEFAQAHIDSTLLAAQVPVGAAKLSAILAAQGRKVVLIESVERLLEKTTRDAFSDLMALAVSDSSMCLILTCRDYSVEQVRASFLQPAGITYAFVDVPPLEDEELAEVESALPTLGYPLKNHRLRTILRNPYFLDKALEIAWSADRALPESEREFRALFWRQIVRADHKGPAGMARQREDVLQKIAVRRARALSTHVFCGDLESSVVAALVQDSLIVSSDENPQMLATAHDVLEDWAILQWMEEQHLTDNETFTSLATAVGTHPAIRRSYRKWVAELVERNPRAADRLFQIAMTDAMTGAQFRDDTLVALLKAPMSPAFLTSHEAQLLANNNATLRRAIHLLRLACVKTPDWLAGKSGPGSLLNVPDGPAWAPVLRVVHGSLGTFSSKDHPLLIGLIEDSVKGVSWWAPNIDGASNVAGIAHWLLARMSHYTYGEARKRILQVLAKIPKADAVNFERILKGSTDNGKRRDPISEDFREMLLCGVEGMPTARDLPELIVSAATEDILASEEDLDRDPYSRNHLDLGPLFGVKEHLQHRFFPCSAYHGPWIQLLRYHPRYGLDFLIRVFNHSADWYAHPRVHDRLEPARETELTFSDGTTQKQWSNPRLWNMYRGTSVGPDALMSLLMALERWLLEVADQRPQELDSLLLDILRRSNSGAMAAVVASVATAAPAFCGETLLVLLTAPDYISLDRGRLAAEASAASLTAMSIGTQPTDNLFHEERKESNRLPHRQQDLESAVLSLQLGPVAPRVHALLDQHLSALPPESEQTESHLIWRLALHRMDLRQYAITEATKLDANEPTESADDSGKKFLRLELNSPATDVQAMVDAHNLEFSATNARLGILMWGLKAFQWQASSDEAGQWKERLTQARTIDCGTEDPLGSQSAPGVIAAVCVRDHWAEMDDDERGWCLEVVCSEIRRHSNNWNQLTRVQRFPMAADRPCAAVVSLLLGKPLSTAQRSRVCPALAEAITHPIEEVREYATWGLSEDLWVTNRELALRCVNAIAVEATLAEQAWNRERQQPYERQRRFEEIIAEAAIAVRTSFCQEGPIAEDAHTKMDCSEGLGAHAATRILAIFRHAPGDELAVATFSRASQALVDSWDAERSRRPRTHRNYQEEHTVVNLLADFLMKTSSDATHRVLEPIIDAVDRHPREIRDIVQSLTRVQDSRPNAAQYWHLWGLFAEKVKSAGWLPYLEGEHPAGSELLSAIFLTSGWKENVRHWKSLEGHAQNVHDLFTALPATAIVLEHYTCFLYHIGEQSLPDAFVSVANFLKRGNPQAMLDGTNTVFLLEVLMQRYVYGRPMELKRDPTVRTAVLFLLDVLVENGSSAAFRMRDDFVTPAT